MLTRIVGKVAVEKEWLEKKLKSLGLSEKKQMIEPNLKNLSLTHQCSLLGLNRSSLYYKNREKLKQKEIKTEITYLKIKGGMVYLAAIRLALKSSPLA